MQKLVEDLIDTNKKINEPKADFPHKIIEDLKLDNETSNNRYLDYNFFSISWFWASFFNLPNFYRK